MHATSSLFLIAALVFTANASVVDRRQEVSNVQSCVGSMADMSPMLDMMAKDITDLNAENVAPMATKFSDSHAQLSAATAKAASFCCTMAAEAISLEESMAMSAQAKMFVPKMEYVVSNMSLKKDVISMNEVYATDAQTSLNGMASQVNELAMCLMARTPEENMAEVKVEMARLNGALGASNFVAEGEKAKLM